MRNVARRSWAPTPMSSSWAPRPARLADLALARLDRLESRWSRFLPQSEISRLNERPGVPVVVAPETFQLIDHALRAWQMTAGRFDPTLLADLRAEGYDRSYELLDRPEPTGAETERDGHRSRTFDVPRAPDIHLDHVVRSVRLGPTTTFDPGGIGKGFAADLVVDELCVERRAGSAREHRRRPPRSRVRLRPRAPGSSRSATRSTRAMSSAISVSLPAQSLRVGGRSARGPAPTDSPATTSSIRAPAARR